MEGIRAFMGLIATTGGYWVSKGGKSSLLLSNRVLFWYIITFYHHKSIFLSSNHSPPTTNQSYPPSTTTFCIINTLQDLFLTVRTTTSCVSMCFKEWSEKMRIDKSPLGIWMCVSKCFWVLWWYQINLLLFSKLLNVKCSVCFKDR